MEPLSSGTDHGTPQTVQHGPGCLVTAQSQYTLQTECVHSLLLINEVPHCRQPTSQRRACLLEDGAGGHCTLVPAMPTDPATSTSLKGLSSLTTTRAHEAIAPAYVFEIFSTRRFIRKPVEKLIPSSGVITTCNRHFGLFRHHYILWYVELKGYPFIINSSYQIINYKTITYEPCSWSE